MPIVFQQILPRFSHEMAGSGDLYSESVASCLPFAITSQMAKIMDLLHLS